MGVRVSSQICIHSKYITHITFKILNTRYIQSTLHTLVTSAAFSIYINADGAIYPLGNPLSKPATNVSCDQKSTIKAQKNSTASEKKRKYVWGATNSLISWLALPPCAES